MQIQVQDGYFNLYKTLLDLYTKMIGALIL